MSVLTPYIYKDKLKILNFFQFIPRREAKGLLEGLLSKFISQQSGFSLVEVMIATTLLAGVGVVTSDVIQNVSQASKSQEQLNFSRNETMAFFKQVHNAGSTVLPDACSESETSRNVTDEEDEKKSALNMSIDLGGDKNPEFVLMNTCVPKPKGLSDPPLMDKTYLQDIVRKDATKRKSNRLNYGEAECLRQMRVSCPVGYVPVTRLSYYNKNGDPKTSTFPAGRKSTHGSFTSFVCRGCKSAQPT